MTGEESPGLHLFEGFGIEIEYAIVDRTSMAIRPCADRALEALGGEPASDVELGPIAASNELVLHVLELKSNGPAHSLEGLDGEFARAVTRVNRALEAQDARLMPTAMHPFMNPLRETTLWPHDQNEIYERFDAIFGCKGHGWSNLQSMHVNLPFQGDGEFGKLHAAVRLVLPLLPALAASSPLVEGRPTELLDNRLEYYRNNARRIPSVAGSVVPEAVFSRADYERTILDAIARDVRPYDPDEILEPEWTNSRGAIARFVRDAIEIRVIDTQECPTADIAVAAATVAAVRALVDERWCAREEQRRFEVGALARVFLSAVERGDAAVVEDTDYLGCFGLSESKISMRDLWSHLVETLLPDSDPFVGPLRHILGHGCLARRIVRRLGTEPGHRAVVDVYGELADCLSENRLFS